MSYYVRLGQVEIPPDLLQRVDVAGGEVSFLGAVLPGDPTDFLSNLEEMKGTTQRLQWRTRQAERNDVVHVEDLSVQERQGQDGKVFTHFYCRTKVVG